MLAVEVRNESDRLLGLVNLGDRAGEKIASLSHGMRRRVAVATALVGNPRLVLLDEPLSGLDPRQAKALRDALSELRGVGTLVISSHNLYELERLCDHVILVSNGVCTEQGPMTEVTGQTSLVEWTLGAGPAPLAALTGALPGDTFEVVGEVLVQRAAGDLDASSVVVMRELAAAGIPVREVRRGVGLERKFMDG